jgi:hypothetical protein
MRYEHWSQAQFATSNNRQQQATTALLIAMNTIKTNTKYNGQDQHHYCELPKRSQDIPTNATRKAVAISLKAASWPCQQTQQGRCEGVVSIRRIPIPQQQLLSQERQSPQCMCNKRIQEAN